MNSNSDVFINQSVELPEEKSMNKVVIVENVVICNNNRQTDLNEEIDSEISSDENFLDVSCLMEEI